MGEAYPYLRPVATTARTTTGDLALPRVFVTDFVACTVQAMKDALNLWQTEWFLDQNAGFPWQRILGIKSPSSMQVQQLIRQQLLAIPGVVSVTASATFDRVKRAFTYNFAAQLANGQQITGGSATPFQVTGSP